MRSLLFIDGSVNNQSKVGYGAYLRISDLESSTEELKQQIRIKKFEQTSSTKLELQTLLWALAEVEPKDNKITVYSDSQNIIGLLSRKEKLFQNDFKSKSGNLIKNHELYKEFFSVTDLIHCEFIKVKGHQLSKNKCDIDHLFTLVDRASRNALRNDISL